LLEHLNELGDDEMVMLKLSIPTKTNLYKECIDHPKCIRVVALSGGYARLEANELLSRQTGMIASFSRALTEGLGHQQSDDEFDRTLKEAVDGIFKASKAG
jgi:fructose-bisphosphate aldolase class I